MRTLVLALSIFLSGCHHSENEKESEAAVKKVSAKNKFSENKTCVKDTVVSPSPVEQPLKKIHPKNSANSESIQALTEPSKQYQIMNEQTLVLQVVLSPKMYRQFPDTLSTLAIANYKANEELFPRAIADNFENGTSKEIISYPQQLNFRFELLENKNSKKPYGTKDVLVVRDSKGNLSAVENSPR